MNLTIIYRKSTNYLEDHFFIQCSKELIDSVRTCPLSVNLYSIRGGISLYDFLLKIPLFSSSFRRVANVLLLNPFIEFLNFRFLTGLVVQIKVLEFQ